MKIIRWLRSTSSYLSIRIVGYNENVFCLTITRSGSDLQFMILVKILKYWKQTISHIFGFFFLFLLKNHCQRMKNLIVIINGIGDVINFIVQLRPPADDRMYDSRICIVSLN